LRAKLIRGTEIPVLVDDVLESGIRGDIENLAFAERMVVRVVPAEVDRGLARDSAPVQRRLREDALGGCNSRRGKRYRERKESA